MEKINTVPEDSNPKWWKSKTQNIITFMALIFMFSFLTLLLFNEIPDKNRDIVNILVTLLFPSLTGGILWYLYGYKRKDIDASDSSNSKVTTTITQKVEPKPVVE